MEYSIKMTIICVDEIIKSKPIRNSLEYWEEVKSQINKL